MHPIHPRAPDSLSRYSNVLSLVYVKGALYLIVFFEQRILLDNILVLTDTWSVLGDGFIAVDGRLSILPLLFVDTSLANRIDFL
jgi:hypothetical protein